MIRLTDSYFCHTCQTWCRDDTPCNCCVDAAETKEYQEYLANKGKQP